MFSFFLIFPGLSFIYLFPEVQLWESQLSSGEMGQRDLRVMGGKTGTGFIID